jgi:phage pi2 protein 07
MNCRKSWDNADRTIKDIIKVPKIYSKQLTSVSGDVVYYIEKSWARRNELENILNLFKVHPMNPEFFLSFKQIERI